MSFCHIYSGKHEFWYRILGFERFTNVIALPWGSLAYPEKSTVIQFAIRSSFLTTSSWVFIILTMARLCVNFLISFLIFAEVLKSPFKFGELSAIISSKIPYKYFFNYAHFWVFDVLLPFNIFPLLFKLCILCFSIFSFTNGFPYLLLSATETFKFMFHFHHYVFFFFQISAFLGISKIPMWFFKIFWILWIHFHLFERETEIPYLLAHSPSTWNHREQGQEPQDSGLLCGWHPTP